MFNSSSSLTFNDGLFRMESFTCQKKGIKDIAYLDPQTVNENTLEHEDTYHYLLEAFHALKFKQHILLSYNCK